MESEAQNPTKQSRLTPTSEKRVPKKVVDVVPVDGIEPQEKTKKRKEMSPEELLTHKKKLKKKSDGQKVKGSLRISYI